MLFYFRLYINYYYYEQMLRSYSICIHIVQFPGLWYASKFVFGYIHSYVRSKQQITVKFSVGHSVEQLDKFHIPFGIIKLKCICIPFYSPTKQKAQIKSKGTTSIEWGSSSRATSSAHIVLNSQLCKRHNLGFVFLIHIGIFVAK